MKPLKIVMRQVIRAYFRIKNWKDYSETIEGGNQVIIEYLKRYEK